MSTPLPKSLAIAPILERTRSPTILASKDARWCLMVSVATRGRARSDRRRRTVSESPSSRLGTTARRKLQRNRNAQAEIQRLAVAGGFRAFLLRSRPQFSPHVYHRNESARFARDLVRDGLLVCDCARHARPWQKPLRGRVIGLAPHRCRPARRQDRPALSGPRDADAVAGFAAPANGRSASERGANAKLALSHYAFVHLAAAAMDACWATSSLCKHPQLRVFPIRRGLPGTTFTRPQSQRQSQAGLL